MNKTKESEEGRGELSRVLYELSVNERGELEVWMDTEMPPTIVLAVLSVLENSRDKIKRCLSWGGSDE